MFFLGMDIGAHVEANGDGPRAVAGGRANVCTDVNVPGTTFFRAARRVIAAAHISRCNGGSIRSNRFDIFCLIPVSFKIALKRGGQQVRVHLVRWQAREAHGASLAVISRLCARLGFRHTHGAGVARG